MTLDFSRHRFKEVLEKPLLRADEGRTFLGNNIVRLLLLLMGGMFLCIGGILVFFVRPSEVLTVLHYNVYFGVDLLGAWWQVFILPSMTFLFVLGNIMLAWHFYAKKQERIIAYILLLGSLMLLSGTALGSAAVAYINY